MRRMEKKTKLGFTHRFIPSNKSEARTTTLLLLHGTGGNEEDLIPVGREIAPNGSYTQSQRKSLGERDASFL